MTSFGRQFDFHDVIYRKRHCIVDDRRFQSKQGLQEILTNESLFKMAVLL